MNRHFLSHYGTGVERARLQGGGSRIEFARTKELLERYLPPAPARVLDVGGGPGAYAAWLSERGYAVHLIDPVPLHVEQAASLAAECESGFTAALGDARGLEEPDASYDAVLLLGPLYHLVNRDERVRALAEARRVARSGGIVAAAAISRFASLLDGLRSGYLGSPVFASIVDRDLREGQHRNPERGDGVLNGGARSSVVAPAAQGGDYAGAAMASRACRPRRSPEARPERRRRRGSLVSAARTARPS